MTRQCSAAQGDTMKKMAVIAGLVVWLFSGDWLLGLSAFVLGAGLGASCRPKRGRPCWRSRSRLQWVTVCYRPVLRGHHGPAASGDAQQRLSADGAHRSRLSRRDPGGLLFGQYLVRRLRPLEGVRPAYALTFKSLVMTYVIGDRSCRLRPRVCLELPDDHAGDHRRLVSPAGPALPRAAPAGGGRSVDRAWPACCCSKSAWASPGSMPASASR